MIGFFKNIFSSDKKKEKQDYDKLFIAGKLEKEDEPEEEDKKEPEEQTPPVSHYYFIDHKVDHNDSLYGIALQYGISPDIIKYDNELSSETIYAG